MEFVTIELRPRLQSCNVFVALKNGPSDPIHIQVKLNKDFITLRIGKQVYNLCLLTIRIIPTSLSSLRVTGGWVSFRIQTTPIDTLFGTFGTELVDTVSVKNESLWNSCSSIELPPKEVDLMLSCSCCENNVTNTINLKKVLPLPNNDCDPSEWFCCTHNGDDYSKLLKPRKSDYFYGPYYSILNKDNFISKLRINTETVACNRCLATLGVPQTDGSLKIWNCCIEYTAAGESVSKKRADALADFNAAIKSCLSELMNHQILLEALEHGKTQYLLLKPMEMNLDLLVAPKKIHHFNAIRLESKKVLKVLYNYGETKTTLKNDYLDAKYCQIAVKTMLTGIEHLVLSTKRIPPIYRNVDEHQIGYMYLEGKARLD